MKNIPPEVSGQLAFSVPLFALGLALFLTAFLLIAAALLGLIPNIYYKRENASSKKWKAFWVMVGIAVVCCGLGWFTLGELGNYLTSSTTIMSHVQEITPHS